MAHALLEIFDAASGRQAFDPDALAAANINPITGLATDYLNHFNEITMLIGLVGDMPEMVEELAAWHPTEYEDHFERSTLKSKALAIAAFRAAAPAVRERFGQVVAEMNSAILDIVARLQAADPSEYGRIAAAGDRLFRPLLARASGVIHGVELDANLLATDDYDVTLEELAD